MKKALIAISRQRGHYKIEVYIDAQIHPATVFGCREGLVPVLAALERGEGKKAAVSAASESDTLTAPTSIAVRLPSGRYIAYGLVVAQDPRTNSP
jgi:hypothetical protein